MKEVDTQKAIAAMRERCQNLPAIIRKLKQSEGLTIQGLADGADISADRLKKFFSGQLKNPTVENVMAACIFLRVSLDTLLGNPYGAETNARIAELENENKHLAKDLAHAEKIEALKDETIKRLENDLKSRRPLVYILLAACFVSVVMLINYMRIDMNTPGIGYINPGSIPVVVLIVGAVAAAAIGAGTVFFVQILRKRKK